MRRVGLRNKAFALIGMTLAALAASGQPPEDGMTSRELGIRHEPLQSPGLTVVRGQEVYEYWCKPCHGPELIKPGTGALQAKYQGALPAALAERTDLAPAYVKVIVRQGVSMMPFFRPTEISSADLDAVAAYLARNMVTQ